MEHLSGIELLTLSFFLLFFVACSLTTSNSAPPFHAVFDLINFISVVVDALLPHPPMRHTEEWKEKYQGYFLTIVGVKGLLMLSIFAMCVI